MLQARESSLIPRRSAESLLTQARKSSHRSKILDLKAKIQSEKYFVCPETTPLFYTSLYTDLPREIQLRYNQLTAMANNEITAYFESSLINILSAIQNKYSLDPHLNQYLDYFCEEERDHIQMWLELNAHCWPEVYQEQSAKFVKQPRWTQPLLRWSSTKKSLWPLLLWIMILQEERSVDVAVRSLRMEPEQLEPQFRKVYQHHSADELGHIHADWHLIEMIYSKLSALKKKLYARTFRWAVKEFLITPARLGVEVIKSLIQEFPDLRTQYSLIKEEYSRLDENSDYQEMMYSRSNHPITFQLFDSIKEFHCMESILLHYRVGREE